MKFSNIALATALYGGVVIVSAFQPSSIISTGSNNVISGSVSVSSTTSMVQQQQQQQQQRGIPFILQGASTSETESDTDTDTEDVQQQSSSNPISSTGSKKNDRLNMMKKSTFHRNGFKNVRSDVENTMVQQFKGNIVDELKSNNYKIQKDGVTIYLAKDFGFCWGVERSIALAYEAVQYFPDRTIHITNELIHNPEVHENLTKMNVQLIEKLDNVQSSSNENKLSVNTKNFSTVKDGDVVILPAFGASYDEMQYLDTLTNVQIVDTTCPWVSKVWNTIDKHQKVGATSIIHGKYTHEETIATTSFATNYICVKDYKEATMITDYITQNEYALSKEEFIKYFNKASSDNFDPDLHLSNIGLANQTTMYKKETRAIGQLLQKTLLSKYGPVELKNHYMEFDTICDATQERQDAIHELVENAKELQLDFILVIGGFDSSNTAHLLEIPHMAGIKCYHINRADCITADNTITHRLISGDIITEQFLPTLTTTTTTTTYKNKDVIIGITSGASTPDKAVQDSLSNIFMLKQLLLSSSSTSLSDDDKTVATTELN